MRISFQNQWNKYLGDLNRSESSMFQAQNRVVTGKRINNLGDDPVGLSSSLSMRGLRSGLEQYSKNLDSAKGHLSFAESNVGEMQKVVRRAYELAVSAANASTSQEGRKAMADEVKVLQKRLLELGNSQGATGQYIFAGQKTDIKPFTVDSTGIHFNGDTNDIRAEVAPGETMIVSTDASQEIVTAYQNLSTLVNNLEGGNSAALGSTDLAALQNSDKAFGQTRSEIGSKLKLVTDFKAHHARRTDELTSQISEVEDVDLAAAIVQYQQAQTAYQAALTSVSASTKLSLMDYLR